MCATFWGNKVSENVSAKYAYFAEINQKLLKKLLFLIFRSSITNFYKPISDIILIFCMNLCKSIFDKLVEKKIRRSFGFIGFFVETKRKKFKKF